MAYDPNHPQPGDALDADFIRQQLNELKTLIDALQTQVNAAVTPAQLDAAIATRAAKPTAVDPLPFGASDPPTQAEVQGGFDLLATLITVLKAP